MIAWIPFFFLVILFFILGVIFSFVESSTSTTVRSFLQRNSLMDILDAHLVMEEGIVHNQMTFTPIEAHPSHPKNGLMSSEGSGWLFLIDYEGSCDAHNARNAFGRVTQQCLRTERYNGTEFSVFMTCGSDHYNLTRYNSSNCDPATEDLRNSYPLFGCTALTDDYYVGNVNYESVCLNSTTEYALPDIGTWVIQTEYAKYNCSDEYAFLAQLNGSCYNTESIRNSTSHQKNYNSFIWNYPINFFYEQENCTGRGGSSNQSKCRHYNDPYYDDDQDYFNSIFPAQFSGGISLYRSNQRISAFPSVLPTSLSPSWSISPSLQATVAPSIASTIIPSTFPSVNVSASPSYSPAFSLAPSVAPSVAPSYYPSVMPSQAASSSSSVSTSPSYVSQSPSASSSPTEIPTYSPSSSVPTVSSTVAPSQIPSATPSYSPTEAPSANPSVSPSYSPSYSSTEGPTASPSYSPSFQSLIPTITPSAVPSTYPTAAPTDLPTVQSEAPSIVPTVPPSVSPSAPTSGTPTPFPPSYIPTASPSTSPSLEVTVPPSHSPSTAPSLTPSCSPSLLPSPLPSIVPSYSPSPRPSASPTRITSQLSFSSNITLAGLTTTDLDTASQQALINTTASSMDLPTSDVSYEGAYFQNTASSNVLKRVRSLSTTNTVIVKLKITVPVPSNVDTTALYGNLTYALNISVTSGWFNSTLHTVSIALGATQTSHVNTLGLSISAAVIEPVSSGSSSSTERGLSVGDVIGIVLGGLAVVVLIGYCFLRMSRTSSSRISASLPS